MPKIEPNNYKLALGIIYAELQRDVADGVTRVEDRAEPYFDAFESEGMMEAARPSHYYGHTSGTKTPAAQKSSRGTKRPNNYTLALGIVYNQIMRDFSDGLNTSVQKAPLYFNAFADNGMLEACADTFPMARTVNQKVALGARCRKLVEHRLEEIEGASQIIDLVDAGRPERLPVLEKLLRHAKGAAKMNEANERAFSALSERIQNVPDLIQKKLYPDQNGPRV